MCLSASIAAALAACALLGASAAHAQTSAPITLTPASYTNNVVFATGGGSPVSINNDNVALFVNGFNSYTNGLPASGLLSLSGNTYQFASYGGNTEVLLSGYGSSSPVVTFANPAAYTSLSVLGTSQYSTGTGNAVITFSDNTTSTYTFKANDYYANPDNSKTLGVDKFALANVSDGSLSGNQLEFTPSQITLSVTDASKAISSIQFSAQANTIEVYALSGVAAAPEPSQLVALGLGTLGILGLAARRRKVVA